LSVKRTLMDVYGWVMPVERFGGGRPPLSTVVLPVLKSAMNCPPGAVFVRCDLPVLLQALLHVAMNVVFRAVSFRRIILAVHSPLSIFGVQPQRCVCHDIRTSVAINRSFFGLLSVPQQPLVHATCAAVDHFP
jgi:hypothetical protein